MPSISRRVLIAGTGAVLIPISGCNALRSSSNPSEEESDPHWVKVYLDNRAETHHVTVTITNDGGDVLFENEYELSDSNEADEDATFPASTDPESIVVTVDGTRFERDWPGFERPALPCDGPNEAGVEIYVENARDGTPDVRIEADCQSVTGE
ncbi:hypothetical protein [Halorientalis halophila]|uniref:hypothetical protein n=1 Tax=Halorientalis halophila TaxID=3108499 RepID=UPI00300BDD46